MKKHNEIHSGVLCRINEDGAPADNDRDEVWIPIQNFENRNWISNKGRVLSLARTFIAKDGYQRNYPDKILKLTPKSNGYTRARLYHEGGKTYIDVLVHRLVAIHFITNPNNLPVVNHIDEIRDNNNVNNLEWVTVQQNVTYNGCHLRAAKNRRIPVLQLTLEGDFIQRWNSVIEAEEAGYRAGAIRKVCYGNKRKYKNYIWKYE